MVAMNSATVYRKSLYIASVYGGEHILAGSHFIPWSMVKNEKKKMLLIIIKAKHFKCKCSHRHTNGSTNTDVIRSGLGCRESSYRSSHSLFITWAFVITCFDCNCVSCVMLQLYFTHPPPPHLNRRQGFSWAVFQGSTI